MAKKKEKEEKRSYEYGKVYLPKGLEIALQRYCEKYPGSGTSKAPKLAISILQQWARNIAKTDPDIIQNIDLEED